MFELLSSLFKSDKQKAASKNTDEQKDHPQSIDVTVHGKGLFVVDLDSLMNSTKVQEQVAAYAKQINLKY